VALGTSAGLDKAEGRDVHRLVFLTTSMENLSDKQNTQVCEVTEKAILHHSFKVWHLKAVFAEVCIWYVLHPP